MISEKSQNWIQTIAALSVLIGLLLIIWELRQTQELTRVQLLSGNTDDQIELNFAVMGDRVSEIEIKGCLAPEELTQEELSRYWAYLKVDYLRMVGLIQQESIYDFGRPIENIVRGILRSYLGSKLGMFDYETLSQRDWPVLMQEVAADIIRNNEVIPCEDTFLPMIEYMQQN